MLVSPNGSPFDWPKPDTRMNVAVARVTESGMPLIISIRSAARMNSFSTGPPSS